MNWKIIESNIREAREQLEEIERLISSKKYPAEGELQVMVEHAYHHLNFAWNIRRVTTREYRKHSTIDFNRWGKYPSDIENFIISEITENHPLVGTWITDEEDSNVAFIFSVNSGTNEFTVSGFCRSSGEEFEISNVKWDGEVLEFTARMPSTDCTSINAFQLRADGSADLTLTIFEVWKKKDIKPGELPEGWQAGN
jgi:hypothetical protein